MFGHKRRMAKRAAALKKKPQRRRTRIYLRTYVRWHK